MVQGPNGCIIAQRTTVVDVPPSSDVRIFISATRFAQYPDPVPCYLPGIGIAAVEFSPLYQSLHISSVIKTTGTAKRILRIRFTYLH